MGANKRRELVFCTSIILVLVPMLGIHVEPQVRLKKMKVEKYNIFNFGCAECIEHVK